MKLILRVLVMAVAMATPFVANARAGPTQLDRRENHETRKWLV